MFLLIFDTKKNNPNLAEIVLFKYSDKNYKLELCCKMTEYKH